MQKHKTGIIHGRFQPFHLGHMEYFKQAKEMCEHIVVGITNPDPDLIAFDKTNPNRSSDKNNPFTYWERYLIIKQALLDEGYSFEEFSIVPFPINFPERIKYYIPQNTIHFTRVFEDWNYKKIEVLQQQGFKVEVLFEGTEKDKVFIGTNIRNAIAGEENYEQFLPKGTVKVLKEFNLVNKVK